ncbi:hypothetical protein E5288_WYG013783 [Bos mutus]|uniref:Uncharacterized protein n=1 Tax=Bos mutus TaxID=72004 RepID=A0A6B0QUV8_9CETA|nr:hypothetical protein [Bos mutus]
MKRKQARPPAQTPPRTHPRDQSQAATGLGTPGSDPEPREPLPLRQQEDLEPSTAEHRGPPAPGTDVPPPQREHPPPPAPVPARALAGEPESGDESPPLQGEPALAPAQDPDSQDD